MKKLIIVLSSIALVICALQAQQGQGQGSGGFLGQGTGNPPLDKPPPPPEFGPNAQIPEEILVLQAEAKGLREELRVSRNAVLEGLADASPEEKIVALQNWRLDNADAIAEVQQISGELRALIQANRPDMPGRDVPEEVQGLRDDLRVMRQSLADRRQEAILALGENPTDEAVRAAIEQWRIDNADALAEVQALSEQVRTWFRGNRPGRRGPVGSPGMQQRRDAFKSNLQTMKQNHQQLRSRIQDPTLTQEERQQIMQQFREEQRELVQERKALKRQERLNQGGAGGDRRPGG